MAEPIDPLSVHDRVLAATFACVARFGLGKTTVDDVVKESGVSRATIYRHFEGGRDELIRETVAWELGNYFTDLADHVRQAPDLVALLTDGLMHARRSLLEHELLQKILATEPERLLGLLSTESARSLPFIAAFLSPYIEREASSGRLVPGLDIEASAEYLARGILSLIGSPGGHDLTSRAATADVVRAELLGGLLRTR